MNVSVVIPLYNKARHIARALDSVLAQSHTAFEIIVVDDGSTDGGGAIVRRYPDPRIRLVTQPNAGVSAARNRGVSEATAEWLAFLDADDEWSPEFIETVLELRRRFPDAVVCGTAYRQVKPNGDLLVSCFHGLLPTADRGGRIDFFAGPPGNSPLHSSAVLIQRKALLAAGGFPDGVVYGEDHDTWLRLALRHPIAWSPLPKATMHENAENRTDGRTYIGNFPFFASVRAYVEQSGRDVPLPHSVYAYLARRHTALFAANWLAGNMAVVREIATDCWKVRGFRCKCGFWNLLSRMPYPWVRRIWRIRHPRSGRFAAMSSFTPIRRATGTTSPGNDKPA
jgi:glycosyltransferase involved in cell wall biosynthesis